MKGFVFPLAQSGLPNIDSGPECYMGRVCVKYLTTLSSFQKVLENMTGRNIPLDSWIEDDSGRLQRGGW